MNRVWWARCYERLYSNKREEGGGEEGGEGDQTKQGGEKKGERLKSKKNEKILRFA